MPAIFFAFLSFFAWGIGDFLVAVTARRVEAYSASFWSLLFSSLVLGAYIPFAFADLSNLTLPMFLLNIFLGLLLVAGIIAYREALSVSNTAIVGTIGNAFTMVAAILSIFVFQERISIHQFIIIVLIFVGLFLATVDMRELKNRSVRLEKGVLLGFFAMITWGIYFTFIKIPIREIGWFWPNYFSLLTFPFIYLTMRIRKLPLISLTRHNVLLSFVISIILVRVAELSFNAGIQKGYTAIVAPIAGASPVLFILLAFIFLRDPITKQQIVGIATTLVGVVLLSFLSV